MSNHILVLNLTLIIARKQLFSMESGWEVNKRGDLCYSYGRSSRNTNHRECEFATIFDMPWVWLKSRGFCSMIDSMFHCTRGEKSCSFTWIWTRYIWMWVYLQSLSWIIRWIMAIWLLARSSTGSDWLTREAQKNGWILWGMDWRGFSFADIPLVARLLLHDSDITIKMLESAILQVKLIDWRHEQSMICYH